MTALADRVVTAPVSLDTQLPSVGVVVPTRDRPELLRESLAAILAQDYAGPIDVVVVFDGEAPDHSLFRQFGPPRRRIRVLANTRRPGLAGARNCGLDHLDSDLVAFCDDDDTWTPGKLAAQVRRLQAEPDAEVATCAITVSYDGRRTARMAGRDSVRHADLIASRMAMLHSSTFLIRRSAIQAGVGRPTESIPGSQNEDWDLLLRAARRHPIVHVDEPLVDVRWGRSSYFSRQWDSRVDSLHWMLDQHPELATDRVGAARVYGQLAFGYAVQRRRGAAVRWAARSLRSRWHEPRGVLALAVAAGVPGEAILARLHRHGRGI